MRLPEGYETTVVSRDLGYLYAPQEIRDPETGEYLGRRKVASFNPGLNGVEIDLLEIAELDERSAPGSKHRLLALRELAGIFRLWDSEFGRKVVKQYGGVS